MMDDATAAPETDGDPVQKKRRPEPRFVDVTFTVPGLGQSVTQTYDRLHRGDMACWRANTMPPAMQLSLRERGDLGMITEKRDFTLLETVAAQARDDAKALRRGRQS